MASLPPLGQVEVDVAVKLDKLMAGFAEGHRATERFDRMVSQKANASVQQFTRSTNIAGDSTTRFARSMDAGARSADRYAQGLTHARTETERTARATETAMGAIRRTLLISASTLAAAFGVNALRQTLDSYITFTNRLRSAGIEGERLRQTQESLFVIAQRYGVQLEGLGTLYGRLAQAQNELGASNVQIQNTVEGTAAALRLYGAGTAEARGALIQLTQLLGGIKVQAQEFNSINDGARPILQAVANGIDRYGGSIARLRSEVIEGRLTSREFFQGLQRGLPEIIEQAQRMPLTIGASLERLNNAFGRYIGQTDEALGATQRISLGIAALADNIEVIMPILTALVLAIGAKYVAALGAATLATVRKTAADAAQILASNTLAATQGRVTVATGAAIIPTNAYAGALGGLTLTSNAATAGLTRMQVVMAGTAAVARGVGAAMLTAFGGPVGLAIMAIVGIVILHNREMARAKAELEGFNQMRREANETLEEADRITGALGDASLSTSRSLANLSGQTRNAANDMREFAGATGDAAQQLYRLAEAEKARLEQSLSQRMEQALTARDEALAQVQRLSPRANAFMAGVQSPEANRARAAVEAAQARADEAARTYQALLDQRSRVQATPLERFGPAGSPFAATGGRDLQAEITQSRAQLVVAQRNGNQELQRSLLAEIRLRERIIDLMQTGLNFENAQAQASAERLGRGSSGSSDRQTFSAAQAEAALAGIGATITSRGRTRAQQQVLYDRYLRGEGPLAAPPGTSFHERNQARDIAKTPGMSLARIREAIESAGGQVVELLDEGRHFHVAWRDSARSQADVAEEATRNRERFEQELLALNDALLDARRNETMTAEEMEALERERVTITRDRQKAEIANRLSLGQLDVVQAAALEAANEALRVEQLRAIELRAEQRRREEQARIAEATFDNEMEALRAQEDIADSAAERRAIERRIIAAQEAYERQLLDAIINSPFTSPIDRQLAMIDRAALPGRTAGRVNALDREVERDLLGMDRAMGGDRGHEAELRGIRDQEAERLAIIAEALEQRIILEDEAAQRRIEIERDANLQIQEIEANRQAMQVAAAGATFASLAEMAKGFAGEQSRIYRALFIVSKAFAIAEAVINIQVALAKALALPFPANLAAIAQVAAIGASIVGNIVSISEQFDTGGWTGDGDPRAPAGTVHGQEYVVRAGPAARFRPLLDSINAGRDPTSGFRTGGNLAGGGDLNVSVKNYAPGVEHEVRQLGRGEVEIIAKKIVRAEAPGVIAADLAAPNSRTSKAVTRHTSSRRARQ